MNKRQSMLILNGLLNKEIKPELAYKLLNEDFCKNNTKPIEKQFSCSNPLCKPYVAIYDIVRYKAFLAGNIKLNLENKKGF